MRNTHIEYGLLAQENMSRGPVAGYGAATAGDKLGSVVNTDEEYEAALLQLAGNAKDAEEAQRFLEMMGFISYKHAEHYYASGQYKSADQRAKRIHDASTNGYLERRKKS